MKAQLFFSSVIMGLGPGLAIAQTPTWSRVLTGPNHPQSRFGAAFVYDAQHNQSVLFGGLGASPGGPITFGDTWVTTNRSWSPLQPAATPSARFGPGAAYDTLHNQTVLFGGAIFVNNGIIFSLGDTWVWDGSNWTAKASANNPIPRYFPAMAYDAARNQTVVFGGINANGYVGDTWVWDGSNWTQKFPANRPSARSAASLTYDALRNVVVLFGGVNPAGSQADTWVWDGNNWTQVFPAVSPVSRYGAGFVFDTVQGQSVLFAGTNEVGNLDDTWIWNGSNWTQMFPATSPSMRFYTMMDYDQRYGKIVLFGGGQGAPIGDIYLFDSWVWQ